MKIKGSVLAEALMAVVIMSVSVTVIMQSLMNNLRYTQVHQDYSRALFLLEDKLEEAFCFKVADVFNPKLAVPEPLARFYYAMDMKDLIQEPWLGLKQLDLAVHWPSGTKDRSLDVRIFLPDDHTQTKTTTTFYN